MNNHSGAEPTPPGLWARFRTLAAQAEGWGKLGEAPDDERPVPGRMGSDVPGRSAGGRDSRDSRSLRPGLFTSQEPYVACASRIGLRWSCWPRASVRGGGGGGGGVAAAPPLALQWEVVGERTGGAAPGVGEGGRPAPHVSGFCFPQPHREAVPGSPSTPSPFLPQSPGSALGGGRQGRVPRPDRGDPQPPNTVARFGK